MGLQRQAVPRKMRLRWAAAFLLVGPLLLLSREGRFDGWYGVGAYVAAAVFSGTVAYFGCTWRRVP